MDDASLEVMVAALAEELQETFITKVHQMTPYHLLLRLRGGGRGGERRLLISAAPREAGLHISSRRYLNPPRPLRFCAYLRHHFQGAKIKTIEKVVGDRIVIIRAARRHEEEKQLIIELIGKRGNVLMTRGEEMLIGALMLEKGTPQRLKTGSPYQLPDPVCETATDNRPAILFETIGINDFRTRPEQLQTQYDNWFFPHYKKHYGDLETRNSSKALQQYQRRLQKRVKKLTAEQEEKAKHIDDNRFGDLLKGEIHRLKRGCEKVVVTDYYSTTLEKIELSLNPALSPLANMEKFYKNAKKAKRGLKLIGKRLLATEQEKIYAQELLFQLNCLTADPDREISDEEQELLELAAAITEKRGRRQQPDAAPRRPQAQVKNRNHKHRGVERIDGISGGIIYLGRNVIGNENIYRHLGSPNDLWFHVHNHPGAHVLLKNAPGTAACEEEKMQAATLAATNSKVGMEKMIDVTMIQVKYLRKPKGGRLGQLLLSGPQQILRVNNHG